MRRVYSFVSGFALVAAGLSIVSPAQARCYTFSAYYNGTDLGMGAANAAEERMRSDVAAWALQKHVRHYRIGKVRKKCGEWYFTPLLPHHKCTATARVCTY